MAILSGIVKQINGKQISQVISLSVDTKWVPETSTIPQPFLATYCAEFINKAFCIFLLWPFSSLAYIVYVGCGYC